MDIPQPVKPACTQSMIAKRAPFVLYDQNAVGDTLMR